MEIKGVLFDLEGAVVDIEDLRREVVNDTLNPYKIRISPDNWNLDYRRLRTVDIFQDVILKNDLKATPTDLLAKSRKIRQSLISEFGCELVPGFLEFYNFLVGKNIKVALCSESSKKEVQLIMKKSGIPKMSLISREDYKFPKPDPEIYNKGIHLLDIKHKETLVFDNRIEGLVAAKAAKCKVVFMDTEHEEGFEKFDIVTKVNNYKEINFVDLFKL